MVDQAYAQPCLAFDVDRRYHFYKCWWVPDLKVSKLSHFLRILMHVVRFWLIKVAFVFRVFASPPHFMIFLPMLSFFLEAGRAEKERAVLIANMKTGQQYEDKQKCVYHSLFNSLRSKVVKFKPVLWNLQISNDWGSAKVWNYHSPGPIFSNRFN